MPGFTPFACQRCTPCLIRRKKLWASRIILESYCHQENSFITLTYDEEHYPKDGSLQISHYRDFLKRVRYHAGPFRYYIVGEYGDRTQRAHYHAALFGLGPDSEELLSKAWGYGFIDVGDLNPKSAQYIAGYVTKKLTKKGDERLNGRHPEFARMSLKPGIGATAIPLLDKILRGEHGEKIYKDEGDVPSFLLHGSKKFPLGRYLKKLIRKELGLEDLSTPKEKLKEIHHTLYDVFLESFEKEPDQSKHNKKRAWADFLKNHNSQKILNLENKTNIFKKRGTV